MSRPIPFDLLHQSLRAIEIQVFQELIYYLPTNQLHLIDTLDVEYIEGWVCILIPPGITVDEEPKIFGGQAYLAQPFLLTVPIQQV